MAQDILQVSAIVNRFKVLSSPPPLKTGTLSTHRTAPLKPATLSRWRQGRTVAQSGRTGWYFENQLFIKGVQFTRANWRHFFPTFLRALYAAEQSQQAAARQGFLRRSMEGTRSNIVPQPSALLTKCEYFQFNPPDAPAGTEKATGEANTYGLQQFKAWDIPVHNYLTNRNTSRSWGSQCEMYPLSLSRVDRVGFPPTPQVFWHYFFNRQPWNKIKRLPESPPATTLCFVPLTPYNSSAHAPALAAHRPLPFKTKF